MVTISSRAKLKRGRVFTNALDSQSNLPPDSGTRQLGLSFPESSWGMAFLFLCFCHTKGVTFSPAGAPHFSKTLGERKLSHKKGVAFSPAGSPIASKQCCALGPFGGYMAWHLLFLRFCHTKGATFSPAGAPHFCCLPLRWFWFWFASESSFFGPRRTLPRPSWCPSGRTSARGAGASVGFGGGGGGVEVTRSFSWVQSSASFWQTKKMANRRGGLRRVLSQRWRRSSGVIAG